MKDSSRIHRTLFSHPLIAGVRYIHGFCDSPAAPGITAEVVDVALRHRVIPSLHRALVSSGIKPPTILEEQLALEARRHLLRRAVIGGLLEELHRKGLGVLIYKGVALDGVYNGILRPAGDIDLIVDPSDLSGVLEVAERLGAKRTQIHAEELSLSIEGVLVEVHTQLVERHIATLPQTNSLFARSIQCPHAFWTWRTLAPADHLVALLVHGFKHQWCRLGWILDIGLFARQMSGAELEVAGELARAHNVGGIFTLGLELADHILHGAPIHNSIAARYAQRLFHPGTSLGFQLENIALHLLVLEGYSSRSRYIFRRGSSALRSATNIFPGVCLRPFLKPKG
jgi:hypothetical protein